MEKKTYSKVYWLGKIHSFTDSPICPTMVLVSWGWDNKVAQAEWFKKKLLYDRNLFMYRNLLYDSSDGYKSQATKSCYRQGHAPLETPGIILPFLIRYCWWAIDA